MVNSYKLSTKNSYTMPSSRTSPRHNSALKLQWKSTSSSTNSLSLTTPSRVTPNMSPRGSFLVDAPTSAKHNSFCDTSFDVPPGGKPMDEVRNALQLLISTIQETDDSDFVVQFNQCLTSSDVSFAVSPKLLIIDASSLTKFNSKLALCFPQCEPRNNKIYTKIQFMHSCPLEDVTDNLKDSHITISPCARKLYRTGMCH